MRIYVEPDLVICFIVTNYISTPDCVPDPGPVESEVQAFGSRFNSFQLRIRPTFNGNKYKKLVFLNKNSCCNTREDVGLLVFHTKHVSKVTKKR